MTKPKPQAVITPDMRRRINRIAHAESLKYAISARSSITADIQRLVDSGAPPTYLDRHLSHLESTS
jgi:hypothetical protein